MNVLVTGASGFIGQTLIRRLSDAGHDVRAMARRPETVAAHPRVSTVAGDMLDPRSLDQATAGMDVVVHLACATGVPNARRAHAVNVAGTQALLDSIRRNGVRRIVFVSSVSATRRRLGPYGRTKKEGEALVAHSGLEWVTLRPSLVYGPAGPNGAGLFASLARNMRLLPVVPVIGDGRIELDPIHVDDVCEVIVQCVSRPDVVGKTYDLLGPTRVTIEEFLSRLGSEMGMRKPHVHVPEGVAMFAASTLGIVLQRPPLSVDNVLGLTSPAQVDREPARRDFAIHWTTLSEALPALAHAAANGGAAAANGTPATAAAPAHVPVLSHPLAAEDLALAPRPLHPVRACVIGLGKMGVVHTAVLSMIPDCEVVGIADHHPALGRSVRGMGHRAPFFRSAERMLTVTKPDAVFICTQQDAHAELARLALRSGAAVFIEKPLAHTLADAEAIAKAAAASGQVVSCGYTLAYLPVFVHAREGVAALGAIRQVRSSMNLSQVFGPRSGWMYDPARSGGGVVMNISSHLLFLLEWYLGTPVEVRAAWKKLYGPVEDELHGMMTLPGGAEVGFDSSWSVPGFPLSAVVIEIDGENGKLLVSNDALELDLREARAGWPAGHTRIGHAELPQPGRFDVNGDGYYLEDAAFLAWATGGPAPPATVDAALRVQRVIDALYRSAASDGQTVRVAG